VKDPEEFHSPQLLELFQPAPLAAFARSFPREYESGPAKNKLQKSGMFLAMNLEAFSHHKNHSFHHDFTSELPSKKHLFFQYPLQKRPQNSKKFAPAVLKYFLSNSTHQKPCQAESKIRTI
jgi:hypothetical protein